MKDARIQGETLEIFFFKVLKAIKCADDVALTTASGLVRTSVRGVDSHGIRLFPHYTRALEAGRINGFPKYKWAKTFPTCTVLDADHTFGHACGTVAMNQAIAIATELGFGAVAVKNSTHFGAAACYGLLPAYHNMIGLSFTNASPLMLSPGGKRAFFGANPICFTAPMEGEDPFCLDMSTTQITWNNVKLHRERNHRLETASYAYDDQANPTDDPQLAKYLAPIGDYKGFGLSIMVDILCGMLSGMPVGIDVSNMYGNPISEKRFLGQFFIAMRIDAFQDPGEFKRRMKNLATNVRKELPKNPTQKVMFPGDPEKEFAQIRSAEGIPVEPFLMEEFLSLSKRYNVPFKINQ